MSKKLIKRGFFKPLAVAGIITLFAGCSMFGTTGDNSTADDTPASGTVKWSYSIDDAVTSIPAIAADGTIYVGSWDDNVYALNGSGGGLGSTPWPKLGKDQRHTSRVTN